MNETIDLTTNDEEKIWTWDEIKEQFWTPRGMMISKAHIAKLMGKPPPVTTAGYYPKQMKATDAPRMSVRKLAPVCSESDYEREEERSDSDNDSTYNVSDDDDAIPHEEGFYQFTREEINQMAYKDFRQGGT